MYQQGSDWLWIGKRPGPMTEPFAPKGWALYLSPLLVTGFTRSSFVSKHQFRAALLPLPTILNLHVSRDLWGNGKRGLGLSSESVFDSCGTWKDLHTGSLKWGDRTRQPLQHDLNLTLHSDLVTWGARKLGAAHPVHIGFGSLCVLWSPLFKSGIEL